MVSIPLLEFFLLVFLLLDLPELLDLNLFVSVKGFFLSLFFLLVVGFKVCLDPFIPFLVSWNKLSSWIKVVNHSLYVSTYQGLAF